MTITGDPLGMMVEPLKEAFGDVVREAVAEAIAPLITRLEALEAEQAKVSELAGKLKGNSLLGKVLGVS